MADKIWTIEKGKSSKILIELIMTLQQKQKIIKLSDQLLTFLLDYRKSHPEFRFWLRSREHNKAGDQQRLAAGQWFQGSDYIFLSFHSASGHVNMTRSIGWVVEVDASLNQHYHISVVWPKETDQRKISLYLDIIETLGGFHQNNETKHRKDLPNGNLLDSLSNFLEVTLPQINQLIAKHGLTDVFTISEEKFKKRLDKVLYYKQQIDSGITENGKTITPIDLEPYQGFLNTILYGPPGTGKTYNTVDKALQIIDPEFYESNSSNRNTLTEKFRELLINDWGESNGQIAFITFHQSMSYEDFIEGIKPVKPDDGTELKYEVVDGIFKLLCTEASRKKDFVITVDETKQSITRELFKELYYGYSESLPLHTEATSSIILKTKEAYPFELFRNTANSIVVKAGEKRTSQHISLNELQCVFFEDKAPLYSSYEQIIIDEILKGKNFQKRAIDNSQKNYVLIIDEVNRGNVSQIFGELITLIEADKRMGETEELAVTLPYSKKRFSVPNNLYILGTMNTADRSVEALDTALRRRFVFEQMLPKPELLNSYQRVKHLWIKYKHTFVDDEEWIDAETDFIEMHGMKFSNKEAYEKLKPDADDVEKELEKLTSGDFKPVIYFDGLDLESLLTVINERLAALLTADHTIGHAWLMDVFSLDDLRNCFKNKILPLLQEYFYNNYAKIGLVLGSSFIEIEESKGIFAKGFAGADDLISDYEDKIIYSFKDPLQLKLNDFKSIYG